MVFISLLCRKKKVKVEQLFNRKTNQTLNQQQQLLKFYTNLNLKYNKKVWLQA